MREEVVVLIIEMLIDIIARVMGWTGLQPKLRPMREPDWDRLKQMLEQGRYQIGVDKGCADGDRTVYTSVTIDDTGHPFIERVDRCK